MWNKIMFMGQTALFFCSCLLVFLLVGTVVQYFWEKETSVNSAVVSGFTVCIAIYQIIATPFILMEGSCTWLTGIYTGVVVLLCLLAGYFYIVGKTRLKKLQMSIRKVVFLFLVLMQAFLSSYLYSEEADDSYYISTSTYIYEQDRVCLEQTEITTGMDYYSTTPKPQISAWEVFLASCGKIFHIKPIILAHSLIPIGAVFLMYGAFAQIGELLFEEEKKREWFLIFFSLFILFSGYSTANVGSFILMRSWQGKSIFVAVVVPVLFAACFKMIQSEKKSYSYWVYNALILLAGICCTPVGIYLGPLLYLMIALSYLCVSSWTEIKKMIIPAICSVIPAACIALYSLTSIVTSGSGSYMTTEVKSWHEIFWEYWNLERWNSWLILGFFIVSLFFIKKYGNKVTKVVFLGSTVMSCCILLNPILHKFIAQKITGVDVYWRLYWLLPVYITIPYMFVYLTEGIKEKKLNKIAACLFCLLIAMTGNNVYKTKDYFQVHQNLERIPAPLKSTLNYILDLKENSVVLVPMEHCEKVRQYTSFLRTPYSRGLYNGSREMETRDITLEEVYKEIYYGQMRNPDVVADVLRELEVEYVVVPKKLRFRKNSELIRKKVIDGYIVYEVMKQYE